MIRFRFGMKGFMRHIFADILHFCHNPVSYTHLGMNPYAARMKAMLIFAFFPLVVFLAQPLGTFSPVSYTHLPKIKSVVPSM